MDEELEKAEPSPATPMKDPQSAFSRFYQSALRAHLAGKSRPEPETIEKFVVQARNSSLALPEFARLHENFLVMELLPGITGGKQEALTRRAGAFFAAAVAATYTDARNGAGKAIESLSGRNVELAAANRHLARRSTGSGKSRQRSATVRMIAGKTWRNPKISSYVCVRFPGRSFPRRRMSGKRSAMSCMT